jgi:uncharacterized tellurite resistance protein B-like protein
MLARLKSLFDERGTPGPRGQDELQLAAAALLVEAARLDDHFDAAEREVIRDVLSRRFAIEAAAVDELIAVADDRITASAEIYGFARIVKNRFSHKQRVELIEMLWEVVYADGTLHHYEASLLRRIAGLIYVSDQESGAARKAALRRLGIATGTG